METVICLFLFCSGRGKSTNESGTIDAETMNMVDTFNFFSLNLSNLHPEDLWVQEIMFS